MFTSSEELPRHLGVVNEDDSPTVLASLLLRLMPQAKLNLRIF